MTLLRRFVVLLALFFWQGGFTFYASAVVPAGQQVLGHLRQGFITRQVTVYLNLAGAAALILLSWDLVAARDPSRWRRWLRYLLWVGMVLALVWLDFLHPRLDALLVRKGFLNLDPEAFRPQHRLYLWISTVQWACGLLYLYLTLLTWRKEDQKLQKKSVLEGSETGSDKKSSAAGSFGVAQSPKKSYGGTR